jgi:hypothetical protein
VSPELHNQRDPDLPRWTVTTVSAPQSVHGTKRRLLKWPARGRKLRELFRRHRVHLAGLQEAGPRTATGFKTVADFVLRLATPNEKRGAWQVGNGIAMSLVVLRRLHRRTFRIRRLNFPGRRLYIPIQLCADTATGDRVIFIAGHADRKKTAPAANQYVLTQLAHLGRWLHARTYCPVIVVLDSNNDAGADRIFRAQHATHLAGDHIDKVYGWGVQGYNARTLDGFAGVVTDHDNPPAVDVSPVVRNFTIRKIPSIPKEL